jgi:hypothetical protein
MSGEAKRDYPASIFFQSGWFRHYKRVEDFFSRMHVALHSGKPACQLLVLHPIESFWAQIHVGWAKWMESDCPHLLQSEARFQQLFEWLSCSSFDFDYADEAILASRARIERNLEGIPQIRVGRAVYQAVLVSGLDTLRSTSLELLKNFAAAGGSVLFCGTPPTHLDALPSTHPAQLADQTVSIPFEKTPLLQTLTQCLRVPFQVRSPHPEGQTDIRCQLRNDGSSAVLALINVSNSRHHSDVHLSFKGNGFVEEWDCNSGDRFQQPVHSEAGHLTWKTDIPPLGERIFVIQPEFQELPCRSPFPTTSAAPLEGPFRFQLNEPNLCVLDFAEFRLGDTDWEPALEILQLDELLRSRLGLPQRSGVMVQPWATRHPLLSTEDPAESPSVPLQLRFSFRINGTLPGPVELLLEEPHSVQILINQSILCPPETPDWIIDPCIKKIPVPTTLLQPGTNQIEIRLPFSAKTQLEAIYLAGSFAVFLSGRHATLDALPETLPPGDLTHLGFPFYSGCISYSLPVPPRHGRAWIETGPFGGALVTLGNDDQAICWPPFRAEIASTDSTEVWCHVWLTRRNTFGPLHLTPKEQTHIGPASFRSKNQAFTDSYQLFPAGLLGSPILHLEPVPPPSPN